LALLVLIIPEIFGCLVAAVTVQVSQRASTIFGEYNPTTNQWTWVSGSRAPDSPGVYGSLSVPALPIFPEHANVPVFFCPRRAD